MIHQKSSFNYARQGYIIILQTPIKGLYSLRFQFNISCSVFLFISIYAKRRAIQILSFRVFPEIPSTYGYSHSFSFLLNLHFHEYICET